MTNEEAILFLKSLPKEAIREVLASPQAQPKSKKIILKGLVTYQNKCLLCDYEWERTEEISFTLTRTSKPGALIRREFTWCGKCSNNLLGFTKEEIVQRAIKIAVKITCPTKEARVYGEYPCNPLREEWNSKFVDSEDDEEVRPQPIQELPEREVGRAPVVIALLGWEGGLSC